MNRLMRRAARVAAVVGLGLAISSAPDRARAEQCCPNFWTPVWNQQHEYWDCYNTVCNPQTSTCCRLG